MSHVLLVQYIQWTTPVLNFTTAVLFPRTQTESRDEQSGRFLRNLLPKRLLVSILFVTEAWVERQKKQGRTLPARKSIVLIVLLLLLQQALQYKQHHPSVGFGGVHSTHSSARVLPRHPLDTYTHPVCLLDHWICSIPIATF